MALSTPLIPPNANARPVDREPVLTPLNDPPDLGVPPPLPELPDNYEQREYFLEGSARTYPESERAAYRTRIIVRTPTDAEDFSGTVVVEWLNVSANFDNAPAYLDSFGGIHRRGDAFVGVSAQKVGVDFQRQANPLRYGSLHHPGDDYSFDIFSQAGWVLKNPGEHDPLEGLRDEHDLLLLGMGNSQSASRLTAYISNGALSDASVYDSLLVFNGGTTTFPGLDPARLSVPVIHMQSEGEASAPQPSAERPSGRLEHPLYRLWWVAGTSHTASYDSWCNFYRQGVVSGVITGDPDRECGQYGELSAIPHPAAFLPNTGLRGGGAAASIVVGAPCMARPNMFPKRYASHAALDALDTWVRTGTPAPPSSAEFVYDDQGALVRDADRNVLGGLRLAPIEVPLAGYVGNSCGLFGHTEPFDDAKLRSRYPTHADYMTKLHAAVEADLADRHLVPADAEDFLTRANAAAFRWEGPMSLPYPLHRVSDNVGVLSDVR
jgi:hypothetical protein